MQKHVQSQPWFDTNWCRTIERKNIGEGNRSRREIPKKLQILLIKKPLKFLTSLDLYVDKQS